jgi:aerobic-type carbon monoxide dehydrogenase small subunit (CoxS/CutS family)
MHASIIDSYICPYCSARLDTFEALKTHVVAEHSTEPFPLPHGVIRISINRKVFELHVEPEWTLYHLIHDQLGMTGTKMFCDRGACGSCTVVMDGRPILSCMTLAIECNGKCIETIEGIAFDHHPLIDAYVKHHALQCGYCTPGFIVTAKACLTIRRTHPMTKSNRRWRAICAGAAHILSIRKQSMRLLKFSWKRDKHDRRKG